MSTDSKSASGSNASTVKVDQKKPPKPEIPDGVTSTNTPNQLKSLLEKIIEAQRPDRVTLDYIGSTWGFRSSSYRANLAALKRVGFLDPESRPTELYNQFRTDGGRANASLTALRNGFPDFFKRKEFADQLGEKELLDLTVDLTGRERSDAAVRSIVGTFRVFAALAEGATRGKESLQPAQHEQASGNHQPLVSPPASSASGIGLVYNINIVLPETTNIDVYNVIFKSIKDNMLK